MTSTSALRCGWLRLVWLCLAVPRVAHAVQEPMRPLLQLEVRDGSGLPLPNARLELFTYAEGGVFREWLGVVPEILGPGVHLLRFSHEGYRPVVFSVPLGKDAPVSLRVQLTSLPGRQRSAATAAPVNAIGLGLGTREGSDVIGSRRVIDRDAYERAHVDGVPEVLRAQSVRKSIGAPEAASPWGFRLRNPRTGESCSPRVMLNGDMTLALSFPRFAELYRTSEPEVIEAVLDGRAVPYTFKREDLDCPVLMVWLRGR